MERRPIVESQIQEQRVGFSLMHKGSQDSAFLSFICRAHLEKDLLLCSPTCPLGDAVKKCSVLRVMFKLFYPFSKSFVCILGIRWPSDSYQGYLLSLLMIVVFIDRSLPCISLVSSIFMALLLPLLDCFVYFIPEIRSICSDVVDYLKYTSFCFFGIVPLLELFRSGIKPAAQC